MSDWSTGAVGPHHRAVLCNGVVIAIAEDTASASAIVRTMNQAPRDRHNLQEATAKIDRVRNCIEQNRGLAWASRLEEVLDGNAR